MEQRAIVLPRVWMQRQKNGEKKTLIDSKEKEHMNDGCNVSAYISQRGFLSHLIARKVKSSQIRAQAILAFPHYVHVSMYI